MCTLLFICQFGFFAAESFQNGEKSKLVHRELILHPQYNMHQTKQGQLLPKHLHDEYSWICLFSYFCYMTVFFGAFLCMNRWIICSSLNESSKILVSSRKNQLSFVFALFRNISRKVVCVRVNQACCLFLTKSGAKFLHHE